MANAGFSAVKNYFGSITGLTAKSSTEGKSSQVAEAIGETGDTVASDVYGTTSSPSVEYAVTGTFTTAAELCLLGDIKTYTEGEGSSAVSRKFMITNCAIKTAANTPPTVTISGVEVEASATTKRTYPVAISLTPRSKAQDVASAFTASTKFTSIDTTFSVDSHIATVGGAPVASDASHGKIEVAATMTDGDGTGTITAAQAGGFTVTAVPTESAPDAGYISRTATATKFVTGTEYVPGT